ncbi:hypothetical protein Sjap_015388 [Stephania japonica]|uniref:Tetraspanin n=1 Tax=Stephania japonica TaxID=461633 RepID=A0AAP0NTY1_9MAGN
MVRVSNTVVAAFNTATLLISFTIIGASVYFHMHHRSECVKALEAPLLAFGVFLLFVSLLGLIGSCCNVYFFFCLYLFVMILMLIGIVAFALFALAVTNKGVGHAVSGAGYKEYRLGDFSNWLKNHFVNEDNWGKIRTCLVDVQVCSLTAGNMTAEQFFKKKLSPIESGCCKPPTSCGFTYKNGTTWTVPQTGSASTDTDCMTWSNKQKTLCYDCNSCKAGVLANLKENWRLYIYISAVVIAIIVFIFFISKAAFR